MKETLLSSSVLIVFTALLRRMLRGRIPPGLQYALWLLVLLRLALPFPLPASPVSAAGTAARITQAAVEEPAPEMDYPSTENRAAGPNPVSVLPSHSLRTVWIAGAAALGLWFAIVDLRLNLRLRRTRRQLCFDAPVPVYAADTLPSPCLYGILRPAVYLTDRAVEDPALAEIAAAHELTHLRHGDNLWAFARVLCLILYWFDPFVWLAAFLSRQDGELFCDEASVRALGESRRWEYGRALLALSERKPRPVERLFGTALSGGARRMRDRVLRIARRPRASAALTAAAVIAMLAAAAFTFTGPAAASARENAPDKAALETPAPTSTPRPAPAVMPDARTPAPAPSSPPAAEAPPPTLSPDDEEDSPTPVRTQAAVESIPDAAPQAMDTFPEPTAPPAEPPETEPAPPASYTFVLRAGEGGSIPAGLESVIGGTYKPGETISLAAREFPGYRFAGWTSSEGGSFDSAEAAQTFFTMPDNDVVVTAVFAAVGGTDPDDAPDFGSEPVLPEPTPNEVPATPDEIPAEPPAPGDDAESPPTEP